MRAISWRIVNLQDVGNHVILQQHFHSILQSGFTLGITRHGDDYHSFPSYFVPQKTQRRNTDGVVEMSLALQVIRLSCGPSRRSCAGERDCSRWKSVWVTKN